THRGKDGRARTHHGAGASLANAMPVFGTFFVGKCGMKNRHLILKNLMDVGGHLRGQTNLRYQQNGRAPGIEYCLHGRQIYSSLPRSGHAMQQDAAKLAAASFVRDAIESRLLRRIELEICLPSGSRQPWLGKFNGLLSELNEAAPSQGFER